jgi:hypothetical protein
MPLIYTGSRDGVEVAEGDTIGDGEIWFPEFETQPLNVSAITMMHNIIRLFSISITM